MTSWDKEIIKKQTATEMVDAYQKACQAVEKAYTILAEAEAQMKAAFGLYTHYGDVHLIDRNISWRPDKPEDTIRDVQLKLKKSAWKRVIDLLEIHKIASVKRQEEIEDRLDKGELPDITVASIYDILITLYQQAPEIQKELVKEVYDILRPRSNWHKSYKTNSDYGVGKKVILIWKVESKYMGGGFRVIYHSQKDLLSVDKVFHLLDGKGIPDGYNGPLCDAIDSSETGDGETDYFEFKCYLNRNLHLTFKRMDLVKSLNAIAGGDKLRNGRDK